MSGQDANGQDANRQDARRSWIVSRDAKIGLAIVLAFVALFAIIIVHRLLRSGEQEQIAGAQAINEGEQRVLTKSAKPEETVRAKTVDAVPFEPSGNTSQPSASFQPSPAVSSDSVLKLKPAASGQQAHPAGTVQADSVARPDSEPAGRLLHAPGQTESALAADQPERHTNLETAGSAAPKSLRPVIEHPAEAIPGPTAEPQQQVPASTGGGPAGTHMGERSLHAANSQLQLPHARSHASSGASQIRRGATAPEPAGTASEPLSPAAGQPADTLRDQSEPLRLSGQPTQQGEPRSPWQPNAPTPSATGPANAGLMPAEPTQQLSRQGESTWQPRAELGGTDSGPGRTQQGQPNSAAMLGPEDNWAPLNQQRRQPAATYQSLTDGRRSSGAESGHNDEAASGRANDTQRPAETEPSLVAGDFEPPAGWQPPPANLPFAQPLEPQQPPADNEPGTADTPLQPANRASPVLQPFGLPADSSHLSQPQQPGSAAAGPAAATASPAIETAGPGAGASNQQPATQLAPTVPPATQASPQATGMPLSSDQYQPGTTAPGGKLEPGQQPGVSSAPDQPPASSLAAQQSGAGASMQPLPPAAQNLPGPGGQMVPAPAAPVGSGPGRATQPIGPAAQAGQPSATGSASPQTQLPPNQYQATGPQDVYASGSPAPGQQPNRGLAAHPVSPPAKPTSRYGQPWAAGQFGWRPNGQKSTVPPPEHRGGSIPARSPSSSQPAGPPAVPYAQPGGPSGAGQGGQRATVLQPNAPYGYAASLPFGPATGTWPAGPTQPQVQEPAPMQSSPEATANLNAANRLAPAGTYVVQRGDSFWSICFKFYGTPKYCRELEEYNRIRWRWLNPGASQEYVLHVGDVIELPSVQVLEQLARAAAPSQQVQTGQSSLPGDCYVVQPGDTLSGIARRFLSDAGRWIEIYKLNRHILTDPNYLRPGMELRLPQTQLGERPGPRDLQ